MKDTAIRKGVPREVAESARAKIYTSGSYRMGLKEKGADIDCICVCPNHVDRDDFFKTLQPRFEKLPHCTDFVTIEGAKVPMIGFVYDGVDIDLLFAQLPRSSIPKTLDILDDETLRDVDEGTLLSLNGPRTTDMIVNCVRGEGGNPKERQRTFLKVLRCVRIWAKRRGIYSNKIGYLGGVNWAILVAFVCKIYPNRPASWVLYRFFWWMKEWKYPLPVQLTTPYDAEIPYKGSKMWNPKKNQYDGRHIMPIITPAYPVYNSSFNVNRSTLQVMKNEFDRAFLLADKVWKGEVAVWDDVFQKTDFFVRYDYYMQVTVSAPDEDKMRRWHGWVESRLRKLVELLEGTQPYGVLSNIQPYHKHITPEGESHAAWHFIAFAVDKSKIYGKALPVHVDHFVDHEISRWPDKTEDMIVLCDVKKWKDLPRELFPDGIDAAKADRRRAKGKSEKAPKGEAAATEGQPESSTVEASMDSCAPIKLEEDEPRAGGVKRERPDEGKVVDDTKKIKPDPAGPSPVPFPSTPAKDATVKGEPEKPDDGKAAVKVDPAAEPPAKPPAEVLEPRPTLLQS